jgi:hypothetical protein
MNDLSIGTEHGNYTIVGDAPPDAQKNKRKLCACKCGRSTIAVRETVLRSGIFSKMCKLCAIEASKRRWTRACYRAPNTTAAGKTDLAR